MYEKTCRCGKTKKNFRFDIGAFFIDECCVEAGYDHLGNRPDLGLVPEKILDDGTSRQMTDEEITELEKTEIASESVVTSTFEGEILSEKKVDDPKKKRQYNRNGKINKQP